MKFNKKLLALLLSLSVIFTSFGVMAEEPVTNVAVKPPVPIESAEYDILQALGFIGEDVKLLNGDSAFTRAQFIGTLFKVAGFADVEYIESELTFADVNETTLYKDEIQYFYNAGYINGTSAYEFSPNNPITYQQAAKIICDLLGYKDFAISRYGNDMNAFVSMAQRLDLNHNMAVTSVITPLTAQNAIIMLYNAGRAKVFDPSYYTSDGDVVYNNWNGEELFVKNSDIYYGEGVMQSNGIVSIVSSDPNESFARINGVDYKLSDIDLTGLVGFNVEFHYKEQNGIKTLIWAGLKDNNDMLVIKASELEPDDGRYDLNTIVYKKNKKNIVLELDDFCDVIYNNSLYNSYNIDDITPEMGFIRLLDRNNDKKYDLVVVEEYENIFAINYSSSLSYFSDKYGNPVRLGDFENVKIYRDGKEITADEVGVNTVLTCVASKPKANPSQKRASLVIYANTELYTSKLVSYSIEDGKSTYEFENITTQLAPSYENLDTSKYNKISPLPGRLYIIYLDREGNIAEIQENSDGYLEYAYVIDAWVNDEIWAPDNSVVFRLLLKNGSFVNAATRKKVRFKNASAPVVNNATGMDIYNTSSLWKDGAVDGTIDEQVVRVTINGEGEITEFELAVNNSDPEGYGYLDGEFSLDYEGEPSIGDSNNGYIMASRYIPDGTTTVFIKYNGLDVEEPYAIIARTGLKPVAGTNMRVYDSSSAHVPAVIAAEHNVASYNEMYAFLVDSIVYKKIDGEFVKHLVGWYGDSWKEMPEYLEGIIPADIKRGDIVKVAQLSNKITKCTTPVHLADRPAPYRDGNHLFSQLYSMSTSSICVLTPENEIPTYGKIFTTWIRSYKIPVKVYDVENDEMYVTTFDAVAPFKAPLANGTFDVADDDVMIFLNRYQNNYITDVIIVLY